MNIMARLQKNENFGSAKGFKDEAASGLRLVANTCYSAIANDSAVSNPIPLLHRSLKT
ncbi:hypothetical protein BH09BAC2_BH09BAC2_10050 [soil metagenome]